MSAEEPFYDYARDENPSVLEEFFEWNGRTYRLYVDETHEHYYDDEGTEILVVPKETPAVRAERFLRWAGKRRQTTT